MMRLSFKRFSVIFAILVTCFSGLMLVNARSFSNRDAGSVANGTITRSITVNPGDFTSSTTIRDVNITLRFGHRHTGTCEQSSGAFYSDVAYRLEGPNGTMVNLIDSGAYLYGAGVSYVTVTLDDRAAATVGGQPRSGSFRPAQSLAAFNGRSPFGTWTLHVIDANFNGTHCFSRFTLDINPPDTSDVDVDGDGLTGSNDNCPTVFNPDQEDGWGSAAGDVCDTDWYNRTGQGVSAFVQKNGLIHVHGNCIYLPDGAPRCPVIAVLNPATFMPASTPIDVTGPQANGWSVWLHYLHSRNGQAVYQVNVYESPSPQADTLVDDRFEIHVGAASWRWWHRGGSDPSIVTDYDLLVVTNPSVPQAANDCQRSRLSWVTVTCAPVPGS